MDGCGKRVISEGEVDRITELPINLREHILDCLSVHDAIRTSVLSSKWRYCWTGLRKLKFDEEFWKLKRDVTLIEHARVIDRILRVHSGPIREFVLYIPYIEHTTVDIEMWLHVLSNNGVKKIEIDASEYMDAGEQFPIPSCLLHCQELKELSLCYCNVTIPSGFRGFANLVKLSLDFCGITTSALEGLISGCLLLETLSLEASNLDEPLALEAYNLKNFYFNDSELKYIIFKDTPKLTRVSLLATLEVAKLDTLSYKTLEWLCSLSGIEELTFDFLLFEPLHEDCPRNIPTPFRNLKSLALRSVNLLLSDDVLYMLCLIQSAPCLEHLTIHLNSKIKGPFKIRKSQQSAARLLESHVKKHVYYSSLKTIKIRGLEGLWHEVLLKKLLETRCRRLKDIVIESGL